MKFQTKPDKLCGKLFDEAEANLKFSTDGSLLSKEVVTSPWIPFLKVSAFMLQSLNNSPPLHKINIVSQLWSHY